MNFHADTSYGDIVLVVDLLDTQGANPKTRPAVIVTPPDQIEANQFVRVIAITTQVSNPLLWD